MCTDLWLKLLRSQEMMHSLYVESPECQEIHEEPHFCLLISVFIVSCSVFLGAWRIPKLWPITSWSMLLLRRCWQTQKQFWRRTFRTEVRLSGFESCQSAWVSPGEFQTFSRFTRLLWHGRCQNINKWNWHKINSRNKWTWGESCRSCCPSLSELWPCPSLTDVLLLIKKRAPTLLPKMADVVAEEKVSPKHLGLTALFMKCGRVTVMDSPWRGWCR